eukprot:1676283-Alexandrium_andersonii.AAC.1
MGKHRVCDRRLKSASTLPLPSIGHRWRDASWPLVRLTSPHHCDWHLAFWLPRSQPPVVTSRRPPAYGWPAAVVRTTGRRGRR